MPYFPMFIDLNNKEVLVIGGGTIAYHKVKVLMDFNASIKVIAPEIHDEIKQCLNITYEERKFCFHDLENMWIVIAATNDKKLNHEIAKACEEQKILYNVVDQMEDCKFIFPSYIIKKDLVVGISSSGKSPLITQYLKKKISSLLSNELAELADIFGGLRPRVKAEISTESLRKKVYQKLLDLFLVEKRLPDENQISSAIKDSKNLELQERKLDDN